jgi:hypothetical protein
VNEITVCAATDVVDLHQIAFPCFRSLSLNSIFIIKNSIKKRNSPNNYV